MPIVTQAARHFQKPWAIVAKYLLAKLLITQRWTEWSIWINGQTAVRHNRNIPMTCVLLAFVALKSSHSSTSRPLLPVSMAVVEARGLSASEDVSTVGPGSPVPEISDFPFPCATFNRSRPSLDRKFPRQSQRQFSDHLPQGSTIPDLIPTFACLQWSYVYDPSVICWHCALLCLFVETNVLWGSRNNQLTVSVNDADTRTMHSSFKHTKSF